MENGLLGRKGREFGVFVKMCVIRSLRRNLGGMLSILIRDDLCLHAYGHILDVSFAFHGVDEGTGIHETQLAQRSLLDAYTSPPYISAPAVRDQPASSSKQERAQPDSSC